MKPFVPFANTNMLGMNSNLNNKNLISFPIFNPMMQQNKPKPANLFSFNPLNKMNNTYQRFSFPENNNLNLNNSNNVLSSNEDRIKKILEGMSVPESLHDYLNRAYQKCNDISEKNQMDKFLKKIVNLAKIQNDIPTRDWRNHPLPSLPRERIEIKKENGNMFSIHSIEINNDDQNESISKIKIYLEIILMTHHFILN